MSDETNAPHLPGSVVTADVPCRRCGYDLRGLPADGACPECGLEAWVSVRDAVDPAARRLPRLADPVGVAHAIVWLAVCELVSTVLLIARPLTLRIDSLDRAGLRNWSAWSPPWLPTLAGLVALLGLWSVWKLLPPPHLRTGVRRALAPLAAGLVGYGVIAGLLGLDVFEAGGTGPQTRLERQITGWTVPLLVMGASAILSFVGLRLVFQTIGRRSREYRTARGGRQRVRDVIAAIVGVMAGEGLKVAGMAARIDWVESLGVIVIWISALMLLIGQGYLVINAWWIGQALKKPRPALGEVLGPALPTGRVRPGGGETMERGEIPTDSA